MVSISSRSSWLPAHGKHRAEMASSPVCGQSCTSCPQGAPPFPSTLKASLSSRGPMGVSAPEQHRRRDQVFLWPWATLVTMPRYHQKVFSWGFGLPTWVIFFLHEPRRISKTSRQFYQVFSLCCSPEICCLVPSMSTVATVLSTLWVWFSK